MRKKAEKRTDKSRGSKYGRHLGKNGIIGIWILLTLSGCSGQELEARDFVSVLTIPEGDSERLLEERQRKSTCILDYSHTKAVILDMDLVQKPEELDEVLKSLISRPEFAWNLLVFTGEEEVLRKAEEEKEKLGLELTAYYKNRKNENMTDGRASLEAERQKETANPLPVTLLDLWNWRTGGGESLNLPVLNWQEDSLIPNGSFKLITS